VIEPAELEPVEPEIPDTRADVVARCIERLSAEWPDKPFTCELLANTYATTWELEQVFAAFDRMGGVEKIGKGKVFGGFGRRRRKDADDDD